MFVVYAVIEFLEHKNNNSSYHILMKQKKLGPFLGAVFGCIPQCGFSVIASDLYSRRAITVGTLFGGVFCQRRMRQCPFSSQTRRFFPTRLKFWELKLIIAAVFRIYCGFYHKNRNRDTNARKATRIFTATASRATTEFCSRRSFTRRKFLFSYFWCRSRLNLLWKNAVGDNVFDFFNTHTVLQPFLTALVGLIPNCAASVILTQCFIAGKITLGALIGGLCTGAGVGLVVLFKFNKNTAQNFLILISLYLCGVFSGIILQMIL
ncbi:MAG: hypothetical protein L6V93_08465 [Clostridiales bacterium]|nr:MAG: hypothetical protein L6V93_08465 [Clostridiales bacterium]